MMYRHALALAVALTIAAPMTASAADLVSTYDLARNNDPQFSSAESSGLIKKEGAVQARSALLPQINGSASIGRTKGNSYNGQYEDPVTGDRFSGDSSSDTTSRNYGVNLQQSVFDWTRINTLRAQRALSQGADYDVIAAGSDLITRTSQAYFSVLVAIETLAAAEAAEKALKQQFDYADKRLEVGLAPITDVHEARAQYDSARANTIVQRNALMDAYEALAQITGEPIRNLRGLPENFTPTMPTESGDSESWVTTALENNPQLKSAEYSVASSEAGIAAAKGGHLPTLSLSGNYGKSASWGTTTFNALDMTRGVGSDGDSRGLSLTLNVPIFSGGATQSQVRQAVAQRDIAQDSYELQKRNVVRSTRNAYQTLLAGISEIEARRLAVVSAQAAYDASQVGLEVGTRTVLDVLLNQQNLFNARQQYAVAKYNYLQYRLLLAQSAGVLDITDVQDINRLLTADAEAQLQSDISTN